MAKKADNALPKGFRRVAGGQVPAWKPAVGDSILGTITRIEVLDAKKIGRENAKKGDKVRVLHVVDNDTGEIVGIWESHAFKGAMDEAKPGMEIYAKLLRVVKKGKRRFNDFDIGLSGKGK